MKYIAGTKTELEAIRAEAEQKLGYPKAPDFVGANVKNPHPTTHAFAVIETVDGHVLTVTKELEDVAATLKTTKAALTTKLVAATTKYTAKLSALGAVTEDPKAVPVDELLTEITKG